MIYLEALGQSILVLNDITMAQDLLEKRSGLYSSRCVGKPKRVKVLCEVDRIGRYSPGMPMLNDVCVFRPQTG
jgi:hypothetical protein